MARLEVPLLYRTLSSTGDVLVRAELELLVKDQAGQWAGRIFRVDSATEMTTMPAYEARQLGLPIPLQAVRGARHAQTGLELRSGALRIQVPGLGTTEHVIPCFFLGDPAAPLSTYPPGAVPRNLLGLSGVIDKLPWAFGGPYGPGAPFGHFTIEER